MEVSLLFSIYLVTAIVSVVVSSILLPATEVSGRRIMSSSGAAIAAFASSGKRIPANDDQDYQIILAQLLTAFIVSNTVFLHADVKGSPYRFKGVPDQPYLGRHLQGRRIYKEILAVTELKVKGRRCLVFDSQNQEIRLKLHWLLHGIADEDIRKAFAAFGKVTEITRERWRLTFVNDNGSTTRTVLLKLTAGMKLDDLPRQIWVGTELALVVAPGRPIRCLRCHGTGHVHRESSSTLFSVPALRTCRRSVPQVIRDCHGPC